jgi:hypothetical protein
MWESNLDSIRFLRFNFRFDGLEGPDGILAPLNEKHIGGYLQKGEDDYSGHTELNRVDLSVVVEERDVSEWIRSEEDKDAGNKIDKVHDYPDIRSIYLAFAPSL